MPAIGLPIAGLLDSIMALAPFILMLLYVAAQLFVRQQKQQRKGPQAPRPNAAGRRPAARGPQAAPDPADEVEAFLRRVAARRTGGPMQDVEVVRPKSPPSPPRRPVVGAPLSPQSRPGTRQTPASKTPVPRGPELISAQLAEPSRLLEHLVKASAVERLEKKSEARVHEVFDHRISHLTSKMPTIENRDAAAVASVSQSSANAQAIAEGLIALIQNPQNLRQAIIFHEIFDPPSNRW